MNLFKLLMIIFPLVSSAMELSDNIRENKKLRINVSGLLFDLDAATLSSDHCKNCYFSTLINWEDHHPQPEKEIRIQRNRYLFDRYISLWLQVGDCTPASPGDAIDCIKEAEFYILPKLKEHLLKYILIWAYNGDCIAKKCIANLKLEMKSQKYETLKHMKESQFVLSVKHLNYGKQIGLLDSDQIIATHENTKFLYDKWDNNVKEYNLATFHQDSKMGKTNKALIYLDVADGTYLFNMVSKLFAKFERYQQVIKVSKINLVTVKDFVIVFDNNSFFAVDLLSMNSCLCCRESTFENIISSIALMH